MLFAFLLTLFAGLATGIGSLIAFVAKSTSKRFLSFALGLSAGVMIYVSFMEIMPIAISSIGEYHQSEKTGQLYATIFFFVGIAIIGIIDRLVPQKENPHEIRSLENMNQKPPKNSLERVGLMTALAIGIHNFPEGIATFTAAVNDPKLGIAIAVAIAIHNIPEGIAVSVPIYHATGSKKKAFKYSFLSGLAEPIGALVGYSILIPFMSPMVLGAVFAIVAGIMVFISLDELLPAAQEWGEHHISILGVIFGMAVMATSLLLF